MNEESKHAGEITTVRSVERAVNLLEILFSYRQPVSLAELSDRADLHPSTAHRILATLDKKRFVYQDPDSRLYSLGAKLLFPAQQFQFINYIRNQAIPILQEVTHELGETASFSTRNGNQVMLVAQVSSGRLVEVTLQPGVEAPLHCTAIGKVLLAHLEPAEVDEIIKETGLPANTPNTLTEADQLTLALEEARQAGYAVDNEEWVEGIRCMAAPVFFSTEDVLGALSISAPANRFTKEQDSQYAAAMMKYANKLSQRIERLLQGDGE
jgi:DNA-binding IclR family transcriptional regulator